LGAPWHCVRWNHNSQVAAAGGDDGAVALLHESGKVLEMLYEGEEGHRPAVVSLAWGARSRWVEVALLLVDERDANIEHRSGVMPRCSAPGCPLSPPTASVPAA
jgi:hypothetical protein